MSPGSRDRDGKGKIKWLKRKNLAGCDPRLELPSLPPGPEDTEVFILVLLRATLS